MRATLPGRPVVIAHRGASGYLPEHTLVAKALAAGMGADYLEQDVVATRDGELIVFHDLVLDAMTDVATRFPGRQRADGCFYCIDFTLAEIRELTIGERRAAGSCSARFPGRFPDGAGRFAIPTFAEEMAFIRGLGDAMGRPLGLYPEVKDPAWHRRHGIDLGARVLEALADAGYDAADGRVFVQCFEAAELQRLRTDLGCRLPLVQLLDSAGGPPSAATLAGIASYAQGIGPSLRLICAGRGAGGPIATGLVADAHAAGLVVHPYTLRREELPAGCDSVDEVLDLVLGQLRADGLFTDFPDLVAGWVGRYIPG